VTKLYFDFRDLFRAARLGLSGKKMGLCFLGILVAYVGCAVLTYVALLASGLGLGSIWRAYRLFPLAMVDQFRWYSWVIYAIGILFALVVLLLTSAAVSKITYQQLKGDDFYSAGDAKKFVAKKWKAVVFSPLGILGIVVFFLVSGVIVGLLGRIPYVGEIGFSVFSLPIFFAAFFTVFLGLVLFVSLILSPAIVGTTGEDTVETITQVFSSIWSQPWRFVVYEGLLAGIIGLGTYILAIFTVNGLSLISWFCGLTMGTKLPELSKVAIGYTPTWGWFKSLVGKIPYIKVLVPNFAEVSGTGGTVLVSGVIAGVMLVLIIGFVFSYSLAIWNAGQTLTYLILRKKKDDENLLERKEEEEEEKKVEEERPKETEEKEEKKAEEPKKEEPKKAEETQEKAEEEKDKG